MTDKEKIRAEVERRRNKHSKAKRIESALEDNAILSFIDYIQEESASEDLEKAAVEWFNSVKYKSDLSATPINTFKAGANWQLNKIK